MSRQCDELIALNERLRADLRAEMVRLAAAFGDTVEPLELPSVSWAAAADGAQMRLGTRVWKFFSRL